jgi:hypothetical protein
VKVPRVRDRSGAGSRFHAALLPPISTALRGCLKNRP